MHRLVYILLLFISLIGLSSCGLIITTALDTAEGGTAKLSYVQPVQDLNPYDSLDVISIINAAGNQAKPEHLERLNSKILANLSVMGVTSKGKGKTLRISGKVLYVENDTLSKLVLIQVLLEDAQTEQTIGIINVSASADGLQEFSSGLDAAAEGLARILVKHHFSGAKQSS